MDRPLEDTETPESILVVEDEPRLRTLWERAIRDMGLHVIAARSGEEALEVVAANPVVVALIDLTLPGMDGMTLLRKLRESDSEMAIIIITGYGTLEAAQEAIHLDVVEFLTKPCSLGTLECAIDRAMRRRHPITDKPRIVEAEATEEYIAASPIDNSGPNSATMADVERQHILTVLQRHSGNRAAAARELGISVRTLYYRLAEYQRQGHKI